MVKISKTPNGYFITVDENEALGLIKSLSTQLLTGNPNVDRIELGNPYFTVAVELDNIDNRRFMKLQIEALEKQVQHLMDRNEWLSNKIKN